MSKENKRLRKGYSKEFKLEAIRLVLEQKRTRSAVERELGIGQGSLHRWIKEYREDKSNVFPGKGHCRPDEEELRMLKRENEILKREREILKKAVAIFSMEPNKYMGS